MTICLVGHRGASAEKPENTLISFKTSLADGMNAFECDVVQSQDGIPFIMHDDRVDRTTNGEGYCYNLPWSFVSALDAGSWKSPDFASVKVPLLEDVLRFFKNEDATILIEMKDNRKYYNLPHQVALLIQKYDMESRCPVMSMNWDYADAVKKFNPKCITGILGCGPGLENALERAVKGGHLFISWDYTSMTQEFVQRIHDFHLKVNVWTVNSEENIQKMIDIGVDSISSDNTRLLKTIAAQNFSCNC